MKCVHGVEMAMSCGECFADFGDGRAGVRNGGIQSNQWVPPPSVDNQLKERMANELASLTQAIQGLSGNVAKLVEEREGDEGHIYRPVGSKEHQADQHELNRSRSALVESLAVKRGPVTDDEITSAMGKTEHWMARCITAREMLEYFAKSRGLID